MKNKILVKSIGIGVSIIFIATFISWRVKQIYVYPVSSDVFEFYTSGKFGLIDVSDGHIITEPIYSDLNCKPSNSEAYCITTLNKKYGMIDLNGEELVDNQYDGLYHINAIDNMVVAVKDSKHQIIDLSGNVLLALDQGIIIKEFVTSNYIVIKNNNQYGVIDLQGNMIVDYLAPDIIIHKIDPLNKIIYTLIDYKRYGFINLNESLTVEPVYENMVNFQEEMAVVKLNGKYGYINHKNETIIPFIYKTANPFSGGLASVQLDTKFGYIDLLNHTVIDYEYDYAGPFKQGVALVANGQSLMNQFFINQENETLPAIHDSRKELNYERDVFNTNGILKTFVVDDGTVYYKYLYEDFGLQFVEGMTSSGRQEFTQVKKENKVILTESFYDIGYMSPSIFCVKKDLWSCYNMEGEKLFERERYLGSVIFVDDDISYAYFKRGNNRYFYNQQGTLIYKSGLQEENHISPSNKYIVSTKGQRILVYNLETKKQETIYKDTYLRSLTKLFPSF